MEVFKVLDSLPETEELYLSKVNTRKWKTRPNETENRLYCEIAWTQHFMGNSSGLFYNEGQ